MKKWIGLVVVLVSTTTGFSQSGDQKTGIKMITKDVKTLSDDKMEGRETGSAGEAMAADYIAGRMEKIGLKPYGIGGYFQPFTFTPKANPHAADSAAEMKPITGKNVIGYLDHGAEYTVVIGAHYDHLGFGGGGSLHAGEKAIHNGADDNASGVSAMLELARMIKANENLNQNNYLFIAFSGEEKGLWGSKSFVANPTIPLANINYMLNMDMVGRLDSNKLAINAVGTSTKWATALDEANTEKMELVEGESGIGPSDHTSFYLEGIPCLHFFTGQHGDYHKPSDDFDKVNVEGVKVVADFMIRVIAAVQPDGKLDYQKTKGNEQDTPRFKVTLGVMPDYMFQGEGMKIDGIIPDRPAEKAGLQRGDIVVKMGEVDIKNMQSYMQGLSQFETGDKAKVVVKRGSEVVNVEVEF
ncbi:MAG: M20/M25/M40 family metallo-hydrolase [Flavobacteriales bacterium]